MFELQLFFSLPTDLQVAIIQRIKDPKSMFGFLFVNKNNLSLFKTHQSTIFQYKIQNVTHYAANPLRIYKDYIINEKKSSPFVREKEENHTKLSYFVYKGYENAVASYLSHLTLRDELRHKVRHNYNLLHLAILSNNPRLVALLLAQPEARALLQESNAYREKAIHFVSKAGNSKLLDLVTQHTDFLKDDINELGNYYSPLGYFCKYCKNDDVHFLQKMIVLGARTDEQYCTNGIPFQLAIQNNKPEVAKILLGYIKEDIKNGRISGRFLLADAIKHGFIDIVKILAFECKVSVDRSRDPDYSLLRASIKLENLELINLVFELESDLYPDVSVDYSNYRGQLSKSPVLGDYLLGAMAALFERKATQNTFDIYALLIARGFHPGMTGYYSEDNVFHLLAKNITAFIGNSADSKTFAQPIIAALLKHDKGLDVQDRPNRKGKTPRQCFPNINPRTAISFEETINHIMRLDGAADLDDRIVDDIDDGKKKVPAHDADHRCTIM